MPDTTDLTAGNGQVDEIEALVVDYLKAGGSDPVTGEKLGEAGVDMAIGIVTLGLTALGIPGAGAALGALKGIFFGGGETIPDAVAKQFELIKKDINALKADVGTLQQNLNDITIKSAMDANGRRCQVVVLALADVKDRALELPAAATKDAAQKKIFVNQVLNRADAFLELGDDIWTWDNVHVQGKSQTNGKVLLVRETVTDLNIALTPYLQAIGVLAAAIDTTGVRLGPSKLQPHFEKLHDLLLSIGGSGDWAKTPSGVEYVDDRITGTKVAGPYLCKDSSECSVTLRCTSAYSTKTRTFRYRPRDDPNYGLQCPYDPRVWEAAWEELRLETWMANYSAIEAITQATSALESAGKFQGQFDTSHTFQMDTLYAIDESGRLYKFQHLITTTEQPARPKLDYTPKTSVLVHALQGPKTTHDFARAALRDRTLGGLKAAGLQDVKATLESPRPELKKSIWKLEPRVGPKTTHEFSRAKLEDGMWDGFNSVVASEWRNSDLLVYGIRPNGDLMWRRIPKVLDGIGVPAAPVFEAPKRVGNGWAAVHNVFSTGEGIVYAVTPSGELVWYHHKNNWDGTLPPDWDQHPVGSNWNQFTRLVSPGDGVIYAVRKDGQLFWYKHASYLTGGRAGEKGAWEGPAQIGSGWDDFKHVVALSADPAGLLVNPAGKCDAHIYAVNARGELLYYVNHDMHDGSSAWDAPVKLADGWDKFVCVFAAMGSRAPVVK